MFPLGYCSFAPHKKGNKKVSVKRVKRGQVKRGQIYLIKKGSGVKRQGEKGSDLFNKLINPTLFLAYCIKVNAMIYFMRGTS
jgi:hypothetical protein